MNALPRPLLFLLPLWLGGAAALATKIPCDDGRLCTVGDACTEDGECVGTMRECADDGDACTTEVCLPSTGECTRLPRGCVGPCRTGRCDPLRGCEAVADGTPCSDDNSCTTGDLCLAGECVGTPLRDGTACRDAFGPCTIGDRCTEGRCSGDSATCPDVDRDRCTFEFCNFLTGACVSLPRRTCDGACEVAACDAVTGDCVPAADGIACDDGNPCTVEDRCQSGECHGRPVRPDDLIATPTVGATVTRTGTRTATSGQATRTATSAPPTGTPMSSEAGGGGGGCAVAPGTAPAWPVLLLWGLSSLRSRSALLRPPRRRRTSRRSRARSAPAPRAGESSASA